MFSVFGVVRALHELLWYLNQAIGLAATAPLYGQLRRARRATEALAAGTAETLLQLDLDAHREPVAALLRSASALARQAAGSPARDHRRADLSAADFKRARLRAATCAAPVCCRRT